MFHKVLATASLGGLLLMGTPALIEGQQAQQGQQSQQAAKSVTGKVTDIADNGHSFTVDTGAGESKQTMKFVVDKNTQVQGQVKVGTMVAVDYQAVDGGQLLCVRVAAQQS
ncbi:MAG: hypothetical protein WAK48_23595 [Candidatus Acidiferrum sp.]|jgi:hypothetical protein